MKFDFLKRGKKESKGKRQNKKENGESFLSIKVKMVLFMGVLLSVICMGFGMVSYINSSKALIR